jgi:hypothetical protein
VTEHQRSGNSPEAAPPRLARSIANGLAIFTAFNFLVADLLFEADSLGRVFLSMVLLGAVAGQLLLLAVWAVFGPARFWRRWLAALAAVGWLYAALVAGMVAADVGPGVSHTYSVNLFLLPLVFLCAQLPLWLLRIVLGRGLTWEGQPSRDGDGTVQYQMRDLLTTFALLGVTLGLARLAVLLHAMDDRHGQNAGQWLGLAVACAAFAAWSALVALPCMGAAFLAADRVKASVAAVGFACVGVLVASALLNTAASSETFFEISGALLAFHSGLVGVLLTGCQVIRGWGYTLRRENAAAPKSQPTLARLPPETASQERAVF